MPIEYWITFGAVALLLGLYQRDRRKCKQQRASFFNPTFDLFQSYRVVQENVAYPILRGRYKGVDIKLEPIVDNMGWRKLPVLFVDVTVFASTGFPVALDYLMRPNGSEIYSQISRIYADSDFICENLRNLWIIASLFVDYEQSFTTVLLGS